MSLLRFLHTARTPDLTRLSTAKSMKCAYSDVKGQKLLQLQITAQINQNITAFLETLFKMVVISFLGFPAFSKENKTRKMQSVSNQAHASGTFKTMEWFPSMNIWWSLKENWESTKGLT